MKFLLSRSHRRKLLHAITCLFHFLGISPAVQSSQMDTSLEANKTEPDKPDFQCPIIDESKLTPLEDVSYSISPTLKMILDKRSWTDDDMVMEIGCGDGFKTVHSILPHVAKYKAYLAIDRDSKIIEVAKLKNPEKKLTYHFASIQNLNTIPKEWGKGITMVVAVDCWYLFYRGDKNAFQNIFSLMAPAGEAVFTYKVAGPLVQLCNEMKKCSKWKPYIRNLPSQMALQSCNEDRHWIIYTMLKKIGFEILLCKREDEVYTFESDDELKDQLNGSFDFMHIPDGLKEEFMEFAYQNVLKSQGRNTSGEPILVYERRIFLVKKRAS